MNDRPAESAQCAQIESSGYYYSDYFVLPEGLSEDEKRQYAKVVNVPWRAGHAGFGWNGGHVRVTRSHFVRSVIAPRILSDAAFPLDRPMVVVEPKETPKSEEGTRQPPSEPNADS